MATVPAAISGKTIAAVLDEESLRAGSMTTSGAAKVRRVRDEENSRQRR